ncbi:hypothetical protein FTV88_2554 [Heliorestis convoluta]|uniref:Uncharacterized protein n=1 Tax=Heliorestis convoluta TaxID=356322 RepID=A0A5Q2N1F7_9FIRM|nr:hypothetical protein FTV88_2554 [Heliorestis convoluta]
MWSIVRRLLPMGVRGFFMYNAARLGLRWIFRNRWTIR